MLSDKHKHAQSVKNEQLRQMLHRMPIRDHADRRAKLHLPDDDAEVWKGLLQGLGVVAVTLILLWVML